MPIMTDKEPSTGDLMVEWFLAEMNIAGYSPVKELRRSDSGVVYLAEDTFHTRFAIKAIAHPSWIKADTANQFLKLIDKARTLRHDNVVRIMDAKVFNDYGLLIMEYLEGEDLARVVERSGPLSIIEACKYAFQAAHGLAAVHEQGLLHRAINPHNLMLGRRGEIKVMDLGLPGVLDKSAMASSFNVRGTLAYMAPELFADPQSVDVRSDYYSLGCTLYYLLTGSAPFSATTAKSIVMHVEASLPDPVHQRRRDVPKRLDDLVMRLLAKDPTRRPETTDIIAEELANFGEFGATTKSTDAADEWSKARRSALEGEELARASGTKRPKPQEEGAGMDAILHEVRSDEKESPEAIAEKLTIASRGQPLIVVLDRDALDWALPDIANWIVRFRHRIQMASLQRISRDGKQRVPDSGEPSPGLPMLEVFGSQFSPEDRDHVLDAGAGIVDRSTYPRESELTPQRWLALTFQSMPAHALQGHGPVLLDPDPQANPSAYNGYAPGIAPGDLQKILDEQARQGR